MGRIAHWHSTASASIPVYDEIQKIKMNLA